jgi:hypothetical protein
VIIAGKWRYSPAASLKRREAMSGAERRPRLRILSGEMSFFKMFGNRSIAAVEREWK